MLNNKGDYDDEDLNICIVNSRLALEQAIKFLNSYTTKTSPFYITILYGIADTFLMLKMHIKLYTLYFR